MSSGISAFLSKRGAGRANVRQDISNYKGMIMPVTKCEPETTRKASRKSVKTQETVLSALLAQTAGNTIGAQQVHRGLIATGDQFISGAAAKAAIRRAFPAAMAAEMEGGAVAQAASMSGVPFAVVRAISDLADGTAAASFEQFEQHAADVSAAAVLQALAEPDERR